MFASLPGEIKPLLKHARWDVRDNALFNYCKRPFELITYEITVVFGEAKMRDSIRKARLRKCTVKDKLLTMSAYLALQYWAITPTRFPRILGNLPMSFFINSGSALQHITGRKNDMRYTTNCMLSISSIINDGSTVIRIRNATVTGSQKAMYTDEIIHSCKTISR